MFQAGQGWTVLFHGDPWFWFLLCAAGSVLRGNDAAVDVPPPLETLRHSDHTFHTDAGCKTESVSLLSIGRTEGGVVPTLGLTDFFCFKASGPDYRNYNKDLHIFYNVLHTV